MNKEAFEAYLKLENIAELMTNINYRYKEQETIEKYQDELVIKMREFKEILRVQKNNLDALRERRQVLYMQITNIDSLSDKTSTLIQKRNLLYDEYKKYTRDLYDNTQSYNKLAESFNKMNSELKQTKLDLVPKKEELNERVELGRYIYDYCFKETKYNNIYETMKKMDENGIFFKKKQNNVVKKENNNEKMNIIKEKKLNSFYNSFGVEGNDLILNKEQKSEIHTRSK